MLSKWCVQIPQPETNLIRVHHILSEALSTTYSVWNVNFSAEEPKVECTTYSVRCVNSFSRKKQNGVHHILSEVRELFQQ